MWCVSVSKARNLPRCRLVQLYPDDLSLLSVPVGPQDPGLLWGQLVPTENNHVSQLNVIQVIQLRKPDMHIIVQWLKESISMRLSVYWRWKTRAFSVLAFVPGVPGYPVGPLRPRGPWKINSRENQHLIKNQKSANQLVVQGWERRRVQLADVPLHVCLFWSWWCHATYLSIKSICNSGNADLPSDQFFQRYQEAHVYPKRQRLFIGCINHCDVGQSPREGRALQRANTGQQHGY